jgi:hypothetical protein
VLLAGLRKRNTLPRTLLSPSLISGHSAQNLPPSPAAAKMSKWNYVVTAHKPTSVSHSCVGNFTGPHELNLIVAYARHSLSLSPNFFFLLITVALLIH